MLSKNLAQYINVNRLVFGSLLDRLVSIFFFKVVIRYMYVGLVVYYDYSAFCLVHQNFFFPE